MHYAIILIQFFSLLCYWGIGVSIPIWYHSHIRTILCSIMIYFLYPSSSILFVFKPHIITIHLKLEYPSDTIIVSYYLVLWYTFNTCLLRLLVFYQHLILSLKSLILNLYTLLIPLLYCIVLRIVTCWHLSFNEQPWFSLISNCGSWDYLWHRTNQTMSAYNRW